MIPESQVLDILRNPLDHDGWTVQGLGMIRLYLDADHVERLHIWDTSQAVKEVSTIHDHPWDFDSLIYFGDIMNQRWILGDLGLPNQTELYASKLICGTGGGLVGDVFKVGATKAPLEHYLKQSTYHMDAPEFHESFPTPGTVTVIRRSFHADRDVAQVAWRTGNWVSAEPRPATREEILHFTQLGLSRV